MSEDNLLRNYQTRLEEAILQKMKYAEPIPPEEARMTIPTRNLLDLPDGAKYGTSSGRATVEAERSGDNIVLTGRCDSIARRCEFYERHVFRQQDTIDALKSAITRLEDQLYRKTFERDSIASQMTFESRRSKPPRTGGKWFLFGFLSGIAITVAGRLLWNRFNVGNLVKKAISKIL